MLKNQRARGTTMSNDVRMRDDDFLSCSYQRADFYIEHGVQ